MRGENVTLEYSDMARPDKGMPNSAAAKSKREKTPDLTHPDMETVMQQDAEKVSIPGITVAVDRDECRDKVPP